MGCLPASLTSCSRRSLFIGGNSAGVPPLFTLGFFLRRGMFPRTFFCRLASTCGTPPPVIFGPSSPPFFHPPDGTLQRLRTILLSLLLVTRLFKDDQFPFSAICEPPSSPTAILSALFRRKRQKSVPPRSFRFTAIPDVLRAGKGRERSAPPFFCPLDVFLSFLTALLLFSSREVSVKAIVEFSMPRLYLGSRR